MDKRIFVIDDWFETYPWYTDDRRWNGWATPKFNHEGVLQIVEN
jgi:hypothetical protein